MALSPFADDQRIDFDETVRLSDVASAFDDDGLGAAGDYMRNGDVLPAGLFRDGMALGVRRAACHQPAASAVQAAFRATDLACAGAAGLGQVDDFLDQGVRFGRERAFPVQSGRPVLFLDLSELKGAAVSLDRGPYAGARPLQQVLPSLAAFRRCLGYLRIVRQRVKEVRGGLDQIGPPITHDMRHAATPRFRATSDLHVARQRLRRTQPELIIPQADFLVVVHHLAGGLHRAVLIAEQVEVGPTGCTEKNRAADEWPPPAGPSRGSVPDAGRTKSTSA